MCVCVCVCKRVSYFFGKYLSNIYIIYPKNNSNKCFIHYKQNHALYGPYTSIELYSYIVTEGTLDEKHAI